MKIKRPWLILGLFVLIIAAWRLIFPSAYGDLLGARALQLSNNQVSQSGPAILNFELTAPGTIGSISVEFCSNDPLPSTPCAAPTGLDVSSAVLTNQTGLGGFSISGLTTANEVVLSRPPTPAAVGTARFFFSGIVNPSVPGAYYIRLLTYATDDATGPASDHGGIAFNIEDNLAVTTTVPPYLLFCTGTSIPGLNCATATGDFINFGELSPSQTSSGTSQMLAATNAELGYSVTTLGTTMASGNNAIGALASNDVSRPGTSQFGFNLRANSSPSGGSDPVGPGAGSPVSSYNQPNSYRFEPNDIVVSHPTTDDVRKYTTSYIANVPATQAPGVYVTTITYVCLANF